MVRSLLTKIAVCCLVLAPSLCIAQSVPKESDDPYFRADNSSFVGSSSQLANRAEIQPRIPEMERPTYRQSPEASQENPLQPATLEKSSANHSQFSSNNDFQPRVEFQAAPQSQLKTNPNNDFRPPGVRDGQLRRLQPPANQNSPRSVNPAPFQKQTEEKRKVFEQSEQFYTPLDQRPTPSNQQRNFTQHTTSPAPMRTSMVSIASPERPQDANEFEPGKVVAIVGGQPIFVGDMLFEANQLLDKFMPGAPAKVKASQRNAVIKRLVPKFIDSKLLLIDTLQDLPEGADFESIMESAQEEFDNKALEILMEQSKVNSPMELDALLRSQGGSLRLMRYKWAEEQLIKYFISRKLDIDTQVSHQEMLTSYRENREQYHQKSKVRWEELSVRFDKTPNRDEARRLLMKMGNEVVYGAPFEAVAKRSSQGFTASEGGKHDWTSLGALAYKDVEKALFSIPLNQLSDVIQSKDGFHIVRVIERTEETYTPFLEAQVEIRKQIENKKRGQAFEDHIKKLRQRIPFEVQLEDVELPEHLAGSPANIK